MPKLKTKRGAAKRLKKTGSGKVKHARAYRRHMLTSKNRKRKRRLGKAVLVAPSNQKAMQRLVPFI
jgi:large subunit ribosomal protein L35